MLLYLCNLNFTVDDKNTGVDNNDDDNHNDDGDSDVELNMESSWHLELSSNTAQSSHCHTPWS